MSVIDLEKSKQISNTKGIAKTIDENALTLILDNVQISQYVFPEASTVRELTSNAIDSQKEKEKAIEILTGKAKVEDYYIKRDDEKYKDSDFNKDYYDLSKLDQSHNRVEIKYIVGKEGVGWCDKFTVKDYGVGLGDKRLYGYFSIGYSSKRNTVSQLGGFGIGAKVGLSLRNDYFTTETVHNGRKFRFNCYSYKVDSLIEKFNSSGEINPTITFPDGTSVYYEVTDSLNYTQVTVPCKTHHKDKFKHAVESQLLYFDNIDFCIIDKNGYEDCKDVKANVVYNSENLIIAEQYQYSKPHIVVVKDKKSPVGVAYGYVAFKEMEMQDLFGSVGFKCPIRQVMRDKDGREVVLQEGVEVTPSRETVIWSDATRAYVKSIIEKATEEANGLIEDQLKEDDFLVWLDKARNVLGNSGDSRVLKQLTSIIDKSQLSPVYQGDKTFRYGPVKDLLWGLNCRLITKTRDWKTQKEEIVRKDAEDWYHFNSQNCYFQLGSTNLAKDHYLIQTTNSGGGFTTIRLLDDESMYSQVKEDEVEITTNKDGSTTTSTKPNKWTKDYVDKLVAKRDRLVGLIKKSKLFKSYDDVVVPEDWNKKFEASEEVVKENAKEEKLTPLELRKLAEQTIVHFLIKQDIPDAIGLPFKWQKNTLKISDLRDDESQVYYSYGDESTIPMATILLWRMYGKDQSLNPEHIKLYRVSKSMPKKFLKKHKHINDFFRIESDKKKTMSAELVEWTTAKYIREKLDELKFMRNYKLFNQEISELYKEVKDYSIKFYNDNYSTFTSKYPSGKEFIEGVLDYTSKVTEFQLFVRDHKDDAKAIQLESQRLFGIDSVEEAVGYNLDMYDKMQILLNYAEPVKALLNHVGLLTDIKNPEVPVDTETMIKEVIVAKGLETFTVPKKVIVIEPEEVIEVVKEEA